MSLRQAAQAAGRQLRGRAAALQLQQSRNAGELLAEVPWGLHNPGVGALRQLGAAMAAPGRPRGCRRSAASSAAAAAQGLPAPPQPRRQPARQAQQVRGAVGDHA